MFVFVFLLVCGVGGTFFVFLVLAVVDWWVGWFAACLPLFVLWSLKGILLCHVVWLHTDALTLVKAHVVSREVIRASVLLWGCVVLNARGVSCFCCWVCGAVCLAFYLSFFVCPLWALGFIE